METVVIDTKSSWGVTIPPLSKVALRLPVGLRSAVTNACIIGECVDTSPIKLVATLDGDEGGDVVCIFVPGRIEHHAVFYRFPTDSNPILTNQGKVPIDVIGTVERIDDESDGSMGEEEEGTFIDPAALASMN